MRTTDCLCFILLCLLSIIDVSANAMPDPVRFSPLTWCDDPSVAKAAGVDKQCDAYAKAMWNQKLQYTLLYDVFCPGCRDYITTSVIPILIPKFKDYVDFEFVPFGDGEATMGGFACGHYNVDACRLNILETCALHFLKQDEDLMYRFIYCIELVAYDHKQPEVTMEYCFKNVSMSLDDQRQLAGCWNSTIGQRLFAQLGIRTLNAWPHVRGAIPWPLFNNASTWPPQYVINQGDVGVTGMVCSAYRGDQLPPACPSFQ